MIVCFKWKQLKKGWEKPELQLLFSSWLDVPLPHFHSPAPPITPVSWAAVWMQAPKAGVSSLPPQGACRGFTVWVSSAPEYQMAF